jgi:CheY-like chemotaxis protein
MTSRQEGAVGEATVLVVEDSDSTGEVLCEVLREERVATAWVRDGGEALSYLAREAPPCLILLDLFMPAPSGFDVLAVLSADPRLREIPVLITSAADARTMARARDLHPGAEVMQKPFDIEVLVERIQHCRS